jgi:hypothetical protein
LTRRLVRTLRAQGQWLRTDRHSGSRLLIDAAKQEIIAAPVDSEQLARRLGVLRQWERLEV